METATIICPKCGCEMYVIPEDLDQIELTYTCNQCHSEFKISFFDICPDCHKSVGFNDSKGFEKNMISFGKSMLKVALDPSSVLNTLMESGKTFIDAYSGNVIDGNGDGICPFCGKRFVRCGGCNELTSVPHEATFEYSFQCSHCKRNVSPNGVKVGMERKHSAAFKQIKPVLSKNSNKHQDSSRSLISNHQKDNRNDLNSTKGIIKILMTIENQFHFDGSNDASHSILDFYSIQKFFKKKYQIHLPIEAKQYKTYGDLADYIMRNKKNLNKSQEQIDITSTHKLEVVCGDGSKIEVPVTEDTQGLRNKPFSMTIVDAFHVEGEGTEVVGKIDAGYITLGDKIYINNNPHAELVVVGIEIRQQLVNYAEFGNKVGLLVQDEPQCKGGDVLTKEITGQYQPTISNTTSISNSEQEYLEELKECLADGELGSSERRLLNKLRDKLGISEERANELEASLSKPQLSEEEKEYVEAYQDALEDGVVSEKERRLLDKLMKINNISEERAKELEKI